MSPHSYAGKDARFKTENTLYKGIRERYLLFVKCIESKPGSEPTNAYLYPQAAVSATHAAAPVATNHH